MSVRWQRFASLSFILLLLYTAPVMGEFFLESAFRPLGLENFPSFYNRYSGFIDALLLILFFVLIAQTVAERSPHLGRKPMMVIGIILGISASTYMWANGITLGSFGWIAVVVILFVISVFLYTFLGHHFKHSLGILGSILIVYGTFRLLLSLIPGLGDMLENSNVSVLINTLDIISIILAFLLILKLLSNKSASGSFFSDGSDSGGGPGIGRSLLGGFRKAKDTAFDTFSEANQSHIRTLKSKIEQDRQRLSASQHKEFAVDYQEKRTITDIVQYAKKLVEEHHKAIQLIDSCIDFIQSFKKGLRYKPVFGKQNVREELEEYKRHIYDEVQVIVQNVNQIERKTNEAIIENKTLLNIEQEQWTQITDLKTTTETEKNNLNRNNPNYQQELEKCTQILKSIDTLESNRSLITFSINRINRILQNIKTNAELFARIYSNNINKDISAFLSAIRAEKTQLAGIDKEFEDNIGQLVNHFKRLEEYEQAKTTVENYLTQQ